MHANTETTTSHTVHAGIDQILSGPTDHKLCNIQENTKDFLNISLAHEKRRWTGAELTDHPSWHYALSNRRTLADFKE